VGTFDTHLGSLGQIRSAPAAAVRAVRHTLISHRHPRQRTTLWVPNRSSTSCDLGIFVDQSAESVAASEAKGGR
jgi:hypothetical protein